MKNTLISLILGSLILVVVGTKISNLISKNGSKKLSDSHIAMNFKSLK